ncbi:hypothetical protein AB3N02_22800 [Priestia aryabhattai]|uniref:hypothetical protein n=1 Tax=Priestia aryabhattai TaxID=412384 RepID=UPI0039A21133
MKKLKTFFKKLGNWLTNILVGAVMVTLAWIATQIIIVMLLVGIDIANSINGGEHEREYAYEFDIEAMKDNDTYVQRRYSGEDDLDFYFIRPMDGALHTGHVDADDSSIVEDGENKVVVYYDLPALGTGANKLLEKFLIGEDHANMKSYEFHVPENSVTEEFNVDLE